MALFKVGDVILDKYEVVRVLGEGGMGVVVAARHRELDELVALKILLPSLQDQPDVCARFAREARTGIRIKNEHVARVLDVGTLADGATFMVMEHLSGEDLSMVIGRRGALPIEEAVDLLLQGAEAIAEAHELGIVHRDLKPGNLFLTTGSDGLPFVKVLDFGISKSIDVESVSVTASAAVLGSPLYMSPEQLASSRDVDRRSDVWSLGVILYEMITGKPPFNGPSFPTLCAAILGGKFPAASTVRSEIPAALDAILASALALDREDRTASVEALAARISLFGSDAGRASSARIQRIARRATSGPSLRASAAPASGFEATLPLVPDSATALPVTTGASGLATGAGLVRPSAPPPRQGGSRVLVGVAAGIALLGGAALVGLRWSSSAARGFEGPAGAGSLPASSAAVSSAPSTVEGADASPRAPVAASVAPDAGTAAAPTASAAPAVTRAKAAPPSNTTPRRAPSGELFGSQK